MLFHAFRVVYTVKELDSHAKHGKSFKKQFGRITEYFCAKNLTSGFVQVSESFFPIVALADVNDGGTPYMGIFPGRTRPCTYRLERERCHQHASSGSRAERMSLKCVFGCEGKISMFSFPKNPALRKQWMQFFFSGQQRSFSIVFVDERYKQGQVRRWICTLFDTERWSGLSYKRSCGYTIRDACTIRSAHALNYVVENVTVSLHYWYHACDETLDGQTAQLAAYFL